MGTIISVVNQKGGVGKTTSSVNIAAAMAKFGLKTLLIDFDPQGHSTEHLNVTKTGSDTVLEAIKGQPVKSCIVPSYLKNLWVLPSDLRLGEFNQDSPEGRQFALKKVLGEDVVDSFDMILIDCQPSLSLLTLNALTASNYVILPVQAEFFALDGLSQLIVTLKEVRAKLHPKLAVLGVVITMYDRRNNLSGEIHSELEKSFGEDLFKTTIPRSVRLAEAPSFGKSIFDYDKDSTGAKAYSELTEELLVKLGYYEEEQNDQ